MARVAQLVMQSLVTPWIDGVYTIIGDILMFTWTVVVPQLSKW